MGTLNTWLPFEVSIRFEDRLVRIKRDYGEVHILNRAEDRALGILSLLLFLAAYSIDPPMIVITPVRKVASRRQTR